VRHFGVASVVPRRSESFGVFPVHPTAAGRRDVLLRELADPFSAADFRHWQVVQPDATRLDELGASILAIEKKRPFVPLERAVMGIRMSEEVVGLQFHPEADPPGMVRHFRSPERAESVIGKVGMEKYERIMHRLESPDYLKRTHDAVIPTFLREAVRALRPEAVEAAAEAA
jgi:GMP synthase-like glutamine amidotransferase